MLDNDQERFSETVEVSFVDAVSTKGMLAISTPAYQTTLHVETQSTHPVLFFHGATVPTQFTSEYRMGGISWMGHLHNYGWKVFGLDLPGYGRSSKYSLCADSNLNPREFGSAAAVQGDIDAAVEWILKKTKTSSLHIIAISRGAIPAGYYSAENPGKVRSLILHAPITKKDGIEPEIIEELLGSREIPRTASFSLSANNRFKMLEEDRPIGTKSNLEPSFVKNWVTDYGKTLGAEKGSSSESVGDQEIATPIGFAVDIFDAWHGKYFDPKAIKCPFLLLRGDWDRFLTPGAETQCLFEEIGSNEKYYVQFPRATHSLLFEQGRHEMYRVVKDFLSRFDIET